MDDSVDDSKYPSKTCSVNDQQNYGSALRFRPPLHSDVQHSRTTNHRFSCAEEEESEEKGGVNGVKMIGKDNYGDDDVIDDVIDDDSDDDSNDDDGNVGIVRHQKKRKMNDLISKYEFAPRLPDWTDHETLALLDAWGDMYIKRGRKSLDPNEWQELADKLSHDTNINRSETQCRDRLEGLENKYKKEKLKLASKGGFGTSDWTFYKKMDILMYSPLQSKTSLSCGVDSGEYVFMDPKVYLDRANGLDEMRDSPTNSNDEDDNDDDDDDDGISTMLKRDEMRREDDRSIGLLADSIEKFGEIYEKVEVSMGKEMAELENMRVDVQRQVETRRRQIRERARIEIARIRDDDDDDDDVSN